MRSEQGEEMKDVKQESPERRALRWLLLDVPLRVDSIRNLLTEVSDEEASAELERFTRAHMRATEFGNPAPAFADLAALVEAGVAMGPKSWAVVKKFHQQVLNAIAMRRYDPHFLKRELRDLAESFAATEELLANHTDLMPGEAEKIAEGRHTLKLLLYESEPRLPKLARAIAAVPETDAIAEMEAFVNERVARYGIPSVPAGWKELRKVMELCAMLMDADNGLSAGVRAAVERLHEVARDRLEQLEIEPSDRLVAQLELHPAPLVDAVQRMMRLSDQQVSSAFWTFASNAMGRMRNGDETAYDRAMETLTALTARQFALTPETRAHIAYAQKRLVQERQSTEEIRQHRREVERRQKELEAITPEMRRNELKEALLEDPISVERLGETITLMENRFVNAEFIAWSGQMQRQVLLGNVRKVADTIIALSTIADQLPITSWEAVATVASRIQQAKALVAEKDVAVCDQAYAAFEHAKTSAPAIRAFWRYAETDALLKIDDVVQDLHAMPSNAAAQDALNTLVERASNALVDDDQECFARALGVFTALAERRGSFLPIEQECIAYGLAQLAREKKYDDAWRAGRALHEEVRRARGIEATDGVQPEAAPDANEPSEQERETAARRTKILARVRIGHFATALPLLVKEFGKEWNEDPELRQAAKEGIGALLDERLLKVDKVEVFARECGFTGDELDAVMRVPKRKAPAKKRQQA